MIGQADIDDQYVVWAASVLPRNHRVQCSAELVRGIGVMQRQTIAVGQEMKLSRVWIVRTV